MAFRGVAILRRCRRCKQWRPIGVFSHHRSPTGRMSNGTICHKCPRDSTHKDARAGYALTDYGRAYLRSVELENRMAS